MFQRLISNDRPASRWLAVLLSAALLGLAAFGFASAPSYAHGVVDPVPAIAAAASARGVRCHVDACMGGFVLPFAELLGRDVPPWDFRVDGAMLEMFQSTVWWVVAVKTVVFLTQGQFSWLFGRIAFADVGLRRGASFVVYDQVKLALS